MYRVVDRLRFAQPFVWPVKKYWKTIYNLQFMNDSVPAVIIVIATVWTLRSNSENYQQVFTVNILGKKPCFVRRLSRTLHNCFLQMMLTHTELFFKFVVSCYLDTKKASKQIGVCLFGTRSPECHLNWHDILSVWAEI